MDENPYKAPAAMQPERKGYNAISIAWIAFELFAIAVIGVPVLLAPDDVKTPAQREMVSFALSLMRAGCAMLAILVVPLGIWTWRRWKRG